MNPNKMRKSDIKASAEYAAIKAAVDLYQELCSPFKILDDLFGPALDYDSKIMRPVFKTFDAYVNEVNLRIGDDHDLIQWYIFDNDCGKKELTLPVGSLLFKVTKVEDLARVMRALHAQRC